MPKVVSSPEINHRTDFALLANDRGYEYIVEVGTDRGVFARQLMERFNGEILCVDPYQPYDEFPWNRTGDLIMACLALQPWHSRARILQCDSVSATHRIPDWMKNRIGMVYIDGDHNYQPCMDDIRIWWPLLPENGMLAGHDYDESHPGVVQAVQEFASENNVKVFITAGDLLPSWYIYKSEPKELHRSWFERATILQEGS